MNVVILLNSRTLNGHNFIQTGELSTCVSVCDLPLALDSWVSPCLTVKLSVLNKRGNFHILFPDKTLIMVVLIKLINFWKQFCYTYLIIYAKHLKKNPLPCKETELYGSSASDIISTNRQLTEGLWGRLLFKGTWLSAG